MTKVVVTIGRLVVHGKEPFASEAFVAQLRQEIAHRIAGGTTAQDIARQLQGKAPGAMHGPMAGPRKAGASGAAEGILASEVAGRLFK